jgi:TonB family protein
MTKSVPKILRVGIIRGGKIIEERLLRKRESVSIGQSPKNTFYIPISRLPRSLPMFEVQGGKYSLCFDDSMTGRVSIRGTVQHLKDFHDNPLTPRKGSTMFLPLDEESRGKVLLGDITVLFQFVPVPPVVPKPQLPASARGGIGVALAANSGFLLALLGAFLLHGVILFSANLVDPEAKIIKKKRFLSPLMTDVQFRAMEEKKDEEKEPEETEEKNVEDEAEDVSDAPPLPPPPKAKKRPKLKRKMPQKPRKSRLDRAKSERQRRVNIRRNTILKHITSAAGPGGTMVDALRSGHAHRPDVFSDSKSGLTVGKPGDIGGFKGQPELAGQNKGLRRLDKGERAGRLRTGRVKTEGKDETTVRVKLKIRVASGRKSGGLGKLDGSTVTRVFRRKQGAFRHCYEKRLKVVPNLKGKVVIRFTIGTAGRITNISVTSNSTGDSAVAKCIQRKVRSWKFSSPEGGSATFTYPIVLSKG